MPPRITTLPSAKTAIGLRQVPSVTTPLAWHAAERPDHCALLDPRDASSLSYGELYPRVEALARGFAQKGWGPGDHLGVAIDRSIEMLIVLLAVLDVGAAYVPLDPTYPTKRLAWMLDDARCRALLVRRGAKTAWARRSGIEVVELDATRFEGPPRHDPEATAGPRQAGPRQAGPRQAGPPAESAAYIIYTSGSSGHPKGVVIPRRALTWYNATCVERYGLTPRDRLLQMASISFDISVGEIFPTLAAGATLVLGGAGPTGADDLLRACRKLEITVLFPATALWHELARVLAEDPGRLPPTLRLVSFGGEMVAADRLADWRRAVGPRVRLVNGYGPTEATVEASHHHLTPPSDGAAASSGAPHPPSVLPPWLDVDAAETTEPSEETGGSSIGRPLPGVRAHIVDPDLRPVAVTDPGELCLSSPGLARGYQDRPAATAERFVPDPFGRRPGARLYRTGDRVRRGNEGRLEILGRLDTQTKIRGFRVEPGEVERHLTTHGGISEAAVVAAGPTDDRWLSAFIVGRNRPEDRNARGSARAGATGILGVGHPGPLDARRDLDESELRGWLRQRLPPYLVPQRITRLTSLPLSTNGKIDRRALVELSESQAESRDQSTAPPIGGVSKTSDRPESPLESLLVRLWMEGLRVSNVALEDNFFELGGDSILGIRIAATARRRDLHLTPAEIFSHPTVAALAALLERRAEQDPALSPRPLDDTSPPSGLVPLTPVQRWFFDEADLAEPWHFNQSMMVTLRRPVAPGLIRRAVVRLLDHHDALRSRFELPGEALAGRGRSRFEAGPWHQRHATTEATAPMLHLDLSGLDASRRGALTTRVADSLQASLDLHHGPLVRVGLFTDGERAKLLVVIHHLVIDGVSWGIVFGDLEHLILALESGEGPDLRRKTTSYGRWAELQQTHAESPALADELDFWLARPTQAPRLPIDSPGEAAAGQTTDTVAAGDTRPGRGPRRLRSNTSDNIATWSSHLDRRRTEDLLRRVGAAYRTRINDVLLTALALAMRRFSGGDLLVDLEGHGREEIFPEIDLSRTVGWFTSTFPVHLSLPTGDDPPRLGGATPGIDLGAALVAVKEQLHALPNQGIGHGMLYYLAGEATRQRLRALPRPEISFNYLGQLDALLADSSLFLPTTEARGREKGRGGRRDYLLEIDGGVVEGRLWMSWQYGKVLYREDSIARLAADFHTALEALIDHCLDPGHGALTPSDVPLAGLDPATLRNLVAEPREVEDLYPLAPMQHGMLFHSLLGATDDGGEAATYFEQSSWELEGTLDRRAFRRAWQRLVDRHPILRTAFRWSGLEQPLQVVFRRRDPSWRELDWRTLDRRRQDRRLDRLLVEDRARGFNLEQAPLSRVVLVRLGPHHHRFLWSYHHTLLDGWSISALFDELFATYDALRQGQPVPEVATVPFRHYIAWLEERPTHGQEELFSTLLAGARPSPPPYAHGGFLPPETGTLRHRRRTRHLAPALGEDLVALARRHHLTLGTVTQGAWSVLLARAQGHADVLYGLTVSGRPAELTGADHIVGLMINSIPVRWRAGGDLPVLPWLAKIQRTMLELAPHEHCSLVEVRRLAGLPADAALFECLLVFENYPVDGAALEERQLRADLVVDGFRGFGETNYPIALAVVPGRRWRLDLAWDPRRLDDTAAERLLRHLENLLADLVRRLASVAPAATAGAVGEGPTLADLDILSPAERHQLIFEWPEHGVPSSAGAPPPFDFHRQPAAIGARGSRGEGEGGILDSVGRWISLGGQVEERGAKLPRQSAAAATAHGSGVQRMARPAFDSMAEPVAESKRSPTATEASLVDELERLWCEVLGLDHLPPEANFFELGGHSLLAMQLVAQLRQRLEIELPLRRVFENPTLDGLSTVVAETLRQRGRSARSAPIVGGPRPDRPPLSPGQRRLWVLEKLDPGDPGYNVAGAWRLDGPLDVPKLHQALLLVSRRHEALRTTFPASGGESWQKITPPEAVDVAFPIVDLRPLPSGRRTEIGQRLADAQALRPFELATGPLQRHLLLRSGENEHLWVRCSHHIVTDAWSENLFYRELSLLYQALVDGRHSPLVPLVAQPVDAALAQLEALDDPDVEQRLASWCTYLAGVDEMPLSADRPATAEYRPGHCRHRLPTALGRNLEGLTRSAGASMFMALVALFSALLHRLGSGETIVFGSPVAHRPTTEHARMIGFFVETVIFRLEVGRQRNFRRLLEHCRDTAFEAWSHQDLPFDRLVEALSPPRRPGRPPLVQVMVDWIDQPAGGLALGASKGERLELAGTSGRWDLSLTGWKEGDEMVLDLEYDAGRFDTSTIRRWLGAFERLGNAAVDTPHHPLYRLELGSPAERHQLLFEATGPGRPPTASLLERLWHQDVTNPHSVALIDGSGGPPWSWRQLAHRIEAWHGTLEAIGARPEEPVVVLVERSPESLAACVAVLTSGALWTPLDPETPGRALERQVEHLGARIVLGSRRSLAVLAPRVRHHLAFEDRDGSARGDRQPPHGPREPRHRRRPRPGILHPLQAMALLHTSGSTGEPKGVMLTHRSLLGYGDDARRAYGITADDRVLQFAHWTFDLLLEEILPALLAGATLVLRTPETAASADAFAAFCHQHRITFATLPTAFWHRLDGITLDTVRTLVIGGEKASPEQLEHWRTLGHPRLHDSYGPTEATVVATRVPVVAPGCPGEEDGAHRTARVEPPADGDLGHPIAGARVLVLDPRLLPTPLGVAGELVLAGEGLARGYRRNAVTTAACFVPDPWADGSSTRPVGGRLYRTGDRARRTGSGRLDFLGRLDRQLKIRGFRIEPAAIETVLGHHPSVDAVVVDAWSEDGRSPRLVAWVVPTADTPPPTVETLGPWLSERLAPHLHPTVWVSLPELPLDDRGKIDRRNLPAPTPSGAAEAISRIAPGSTTERALAEIFARVLGIAEVGRDDNFFHRGGDSLLAIQVTDAARHTGLPMRPMDLLHHPTPGRLAAELDRRSTEEHEALTPSRQSDDPHPGPLPLTPIQRWFFDWEIERRWHFNQSFLLETTRPLDPRRLAQAATWLMRHHDALRLRFERRHGGWGSRQAPAEGCSPMTHLRLEQLEPETAAERLTALCSTFQASLDLARGPLVRLAHFTLPGGAERLLIVVHHLVVDGVSWPILLDDLERLYDRQGAAAPEDPAPSEAVPELPPKTTSYQHWSHALERQARKAELLDEVDHWRRTLARRRSLPVDRGTGLDAWAPGGAVLHSTRLAPDSTRRLLHRAGRKLEPILLTALLRTFGAWSDRSGQLIELESHGRSERLPGVDVSRTIGWFTSTFPVWLELEGDDPDSQVESVMRQLDAVPHDGLHFGLLRYLAPEVDGIGELRRQPGPEISFNYLGQVELPLARSRYFRPAPEDPGPEQGHPGERQHRFDLNGRVVGNQLVIDWGFDPGHYRRPTVEALGRAYFEHLLELIERC